MKAAIRSSALARIFLVAGFGVALSAMPANAQKAGGSITVGLELDIPGFDVLKVGVYDAAALTASSALFDTLTTLDANGKAQPRLALSWEPSEDFKMWTFKLRPGVKFHDGTPFNASAFKANFDRQKDPANKCRCAFYIANVNNVQAPDELTLVYNLNDPSVNFPALVSYASQTNAIHSPTAWKSKGDDYNRNPVGTGPYILKTWTAGDRMILEKNPDYWDKDKVYFDRITLKPLPDAQSRFASLQSGEVDLIWDDEYSADNIQKAQKDSKLTVHTYEGSGAQVYAFNTKVAPFDDLRVRQALVMALDRKKMSQAITNGLARPAGNPYGATPGSCKDDGALPKTLRGQGADQGLRQTCRIQDARHGDARGRTTARCCNSSGSGPAPDGDRAGRPGLIPPRAFMRRFQLTPWRIVDLADPDIQMSPTQDRKPVALASFSIRSSINCSSVRVTADQDKRIDDYCAITRLINKEAIWFWTFQNTYYAISSAKVKGLPKMYSGTIDVSRAWKE
jgi:4-phytase/acid phosphatase/peptide/nickel transport system substrate-binding protein